MSAVKLSRAEAVALVRRIAAGEYAGEDELNDWLDRLDTSLGCPSGHVANLVFWPREGELPAEVVVDRALAYRPLAL
ncbi:e9imm peptide [Streptomyces xiamenensis]|uniref:e9imm peptide n=1 Tax=Streptomyces xiamenensis TaxID=408015 RepID=UPI00342F5DBC